MHEEMTTGSPCYREIVFSVLPPLPPTKVLSISPNVLALVVVVPSRERGLFGSALLSAVVALLVRVNLYAIISLFFSTYAQALLRSGKQQLAPSYYFVLCFLLLLLAFALC